MFPIAFAAFVLAFVVALMVVPLAKRIASQASIVDRPDTNRKLHGRVVPLSGGIAIGISLPVVLIASWLFSDAVAESITNNWIPLIGILLAGTILLGVGLADDRWGVGGRRKLLGQALSAAVFLASFFLQNFLYATAQENALGGSFIQIAIVFGLLFIWLLGSINAVNLIDGADGLASTVGTIAATSIFLLIAKTYTATQVPWEAIMAIGLAGILLGFLFYNFPPATTFLGDSGSMLIGLLVGCLAIQSAHSEPMAIALFAPMAIVAVPFFDSFVAILRRRLTGRSIYTVDRGHLHHTLLERGLSPRGMLAVVAVLCSISSLGGVLSIQLNSAWYAAGSIVVVVGGLIAGRVFGFAEMQLLVYRIYGSSRGWVITDSKLKELPHQQRIRLQGSRNWDNLWEAITEFAEEQELSEVRLDLNLPWLHEGYHAVWHRKVDADSSQCWHTRIPLTGAGKTYGRLEISGPLEETSAYRLLGVLAELLESMETDIIRLAENPDDERPKTQKTTPLKGQEPEFSEAGS